MNRHIYLSKSLFKNALDCRTKLYYACNSDIYKNNRIEDPFLKSIAEGGFQVGELAKCYYPNGIEIDSSLSFEDNFKETKKLLQKKNVVIFEGVLIFNNFMVRFDILEKTGNTIRLIEVKSKSSDGTDFHQQFLNKKNGTIKAAWVDNMYDVALQKWVLSKVYPKYNIESYVMLVDKKLIATVDNLNQKFTLTKDDRNNTKVIINGDVSKKALGAKILSEINVDPVMLLIDGHEYTEGRTFEEWLDYLMESFEKNQKLVTKIGKKCINCQFTCTKEEESKGWKSGKNECWLSNPLVGKENLDKPTVLELWDYRSKDKRIAEGKILMSDLTPSEFMPQFETYEQVSKFFGGLDREMTSKERQALQLWKTNTNDNSIYANIDMLRKEMESWVYPLHMIDFETTMVAIPFHKGMRPYEGIAFQFSHHIIHKDGSVEHAGEYINRKVGHFPNFDFVRELKKQLEVDNGSIFRYSTHENSFLNMILVQMLNTDEIDLPDKKELIDFVKSITHKSSNEGFEDMDEKNETDEWVGERDMIDLWDILKKFYYNPHTGGSNSIKFVLPAILKSSEFLRSKYSEPIYGSDELRSINFKNKTWIQLDDNGNVINPYKQLPEAFEGIDSSIIETFVNDSKIADGGAAMTAYSKIQFSEMSELERESVINALLKYCELDTLAMVMIYEHWMEIVFGRTHTKKVKTEKAVEKIEPLQSLDFKTPVDAYEEIQPIKIQASGLYGKIGDGTKEVDFQTFSDKKDIKVSSVNKNNKSKKMRKPKTTEVERWIERFKKDSTPQLMFKLKSDSYNKHQKVIIGEILDKRSRSMIPSEIAVMKLKKESSNKMINMLRSVNYNDFKKTVIKQILKLRKVKLR